jgi:hypothetical protein
MKRLKYLLFLTPLFIQAGCDDYTMICSLNPFYIEKQVVLLPQIEGVWQANPDLSLDPSIWKTVDKTCHWNVSQKLDGDKKPVNEYLVEIYRNKPDSIGFSFKLRIFMADNQLYADFCNASNIASDNSRLTFENQYPVHTLARIINKDNQIVLSWLNDETMISMIEEKRVRASFKWVNSANRVLLTGSSAQLFEMVEKYCNEKRFVDWEKQEAMLTLTRVN